MLSLFIAVNSQRTLDRLGPTFISSLYVYQIRLIRLITWSGKVECLKYFESETLSWKHKGGVIHKEAIVTLQILIGALTLQN